MGMIFWQAQEVHVWLGDTTPSDIFGLQHAPRFAAAQAEHKRRDGKRHVFQFIPDDFIAYNLPEWQNISAYSSFMSLGDRRVFSRGWVVQEIALARNLTFHCGNFSLSSDDFFSAVQCCGELGNFTVNDSRAQLWRIIIIRLATVQQENIDLIDLLQLTETFGTQDPRDKIYALLGIAQDSEALDIKPDYGTSWIDVYKDVVLRIVETYGVLDVLGAPKEEQVNYKLRIKRPEIRTEILPSWVPDWRFHHEIITNLGGLMGPNPGYHATRNSKAQAMINDYNKDLLGLSGYCVDRIAECGIVEPCLGSVDVRDLSIGGSKLSIIFFLFKICYQGLLICVGGSYQILDWRRTACINTGGNYTTGTESKEDAFWQTLAAGYEFKSDEKVAEAREHYYKWNSEFLHLERFSSFLPRPASTIVLWAAAAGTMLKVFFHALL